MRRGATDYLGVLLLGLLGEELLPHGLFLLLPLVVLIQSVLQRPTPLRGLNKPHTHTYTLLKTYTGTFPPYLWGKKGDWTPEKLQHIISPLGQPSLLARKENPSVRHTVHTHTHTHTRAYDKETGRQTHTHTHIWHMQQISLSSVV